MSSWLDTKKYMASLAKTAMAEAQKTLDKALDIDENTELSLENTENNDSSSANAVIDQWGSFSGSFFAVPPKLGKCFWDKKLVLFHTYPKQWNLLTISQNLVTCSKGKGNVVFKIP